MKLSCFPIFHFFTVRDVLRADSFQIDTQYENQEEIKVYVCLVYAQRKMSRKTEIQYTLLRKSCNFVYVTKSSRSRFSGNI